MCYICFYCCTPFTRNKRKQSTDDLALKIGCQAPIRYDKIIHFNVPIERFPRIVDRLERILIRKILTTYLDSYLNIVLFTF